MDVNFPDLASVLRRIGRGTIYYAVNGGGDPIRWDPGTEMILEHLGDTEGDIVVNMNDEIATLTLPELSGPGVLEATHTGGNPTVEIPLFLADPALRPIVSPSGSASGGFSRVGDVEERTLVIFPENLFKLAGGRWTGFGTLASAGAGAWTLNGVALTDAQTLKLSQSVWLWRGYFSQPSRRFLGGHGDAGKNIETVTFTAMMHPEMPDGNRQFTAGDPADSLIYIEGES